MHDNSTRARIARFVSERVTPAVNRASAPLTISAWEVTDEPVPITETIGQRFEPFSLGQAWAHRGAPRGFT